MISSFAPFLAAVLLFGLSTYFGVFVVESFIRKGELKQEARQGSASRIRAESRWIAPAIWFLSVWVLALFIGYFMVAPGGPAGPAARIDPDHLPRPAIWGDF